MKVFFFLILPINTVLKVNTYNKITVIWFSYQEKSIKRIHKDY